MKPLTSVTLLLAAMFLWSVTGIAQTRTVGLFLNTPEAAPGYTLFAPIPSTVTYLIDNDGLLVHSWQGNTRPALSVYLKENGNLLRPEKITPPQFDGGGAGGQLFEQDWDGNTVWDYAFGNSDRWPHHDIEPLPNGNVLIVAWERKSTAEVIAMGRRPDLAQGGELWPDFIAEVQQWGMKGGIVVWEWHAWDHLIQDYDTTKPNHGVIAEHPERININYPDNARAERLVDWLHTNGIDYNEALDQILLSVRGVNEIWVIDHSTTTEEASGSSGGRYAKGGDILYRWGNPAAYDHGEPEDQKLFLHHDARWIEVGRPGAGNIMVFNNGQGRPGGEYSAVDEFVPPVDSLGAYARLPGQPYEPATFIWNYTAPVPSDFYAANISGAERQVNGNTLICSGPFGTFFEVDANDDIVWRYICPVTRSGPVVQGTVVDDGTANWENQVFRASRFAPDYPAFTGRDLTAGDPIELDPTAIDDHVALVPGFTLEPNRPNPFTNATMIPIQLSRPALLRLSVHDVLGREVALLHEGMLASGHHSIRFDAAGFPAGTYFIRFQAGGMLSVGKMQLMK